MPVIPDFPTERSGFEGELGGHADPGAFGAPGAALEQTGARASAEMDQFATQYAEAKRGVLADNLSLDGMNQMQQSSLKWRQTPDAGAALQGFSQDARQITQNTLQGIDDPMLQKLVTGRLTEHAITLSRQTWVPALDLEQAKWRGDLEQGLEDRANQAGGQSDPLARAQIIDAAHASIKGAVAGGWLHGDQAVTLGRRFDTQLGGSLISTGLQRDPKQTLADLGAGRYDTLLDLETRQRLQPQIDQATALVHANGVAPPGGASAPGGDVADRIIANESGGNPAARNPASSATGGGQFIDSTWLGLVKQNAPDIAAGKSDAEILALRSDPTLTKQMVNAYAATNGATLAAQGLPTDPGSLYLAHFLGAGGAATVLKADPGAPLSSLLSQQVLSANPSLAGMTAGDLRRQMAAKMQGAGSGDPSLAAMYDKIDSLGLDPIAALSAKQYARVQYDANEADQLRQQRAQATAQAQASRGAENEIIADAYSGAPKITATQVADDPRLTPDAKMRMIGVVRRGDDAGPAPGASQMAALGLINRIRAPDGDPARITDDGPIYQALTDNQLTKADFDFVKQQFDQIRTPGGEIFAKRQADFLRSVESQISPKGALGQLDPAGAGRFYQFQWQLGKKTDEYRKAGKDPVDLLDPSKPDYMGKPEALKAFTQPIALRLEDVPPPHDTPPAVQGPPAAAIDYLKSHLELRDQFDAKYGAGAAVPILGPDISPPMAGSSLSAKQLSQLQELMATPEPESVSREEDGDLP